MKKIIFFPLFIKYYYPLLWILNSIYGYLKLIMLLINCGWFEIELIF